MHLVTYSTPQKLEGLSVHWLIHLWKRSSFLLRQGIAHTNAGWAYKAFYGKYQVDHQWHNTSHLKSAMNKPNILGQSTDFLILISLIFVIFTVKRIEQMIPRVPWSFCSQRSMCQNCWLIRVYQNNFISSSLPSFPNTFQCSVTNSVFVDKCVAIIKGKLHCETKELMKFFLLKFK